MVGAAKALGRVTLRRHGLIGRRAGGAVPASSQVRTSVVAPLMRAVGPRIEATRMERH